MLCRKNNKSCTLVINIFGSLISVGLHHMCIGTGVTCLAYNNNNKSIYIAPWFQVTLFKGAVTSKKNAVKN